MSVAQETNPKEGVPEIVPIVLHQSTELRLNGRISEAEHLQKLNRLEREELAPRGFQLEAQNLPDGALRFLIKRQETVCETVECRAQAPRGPFRPGSEDAKSGAAR